MVALHFVAMLGAAGCVFDERAVPLGPADFSPVHIAVPAPAATGRPAMTPASVPEPASRPESTPPVSTREWLRAAQPQLEKLLPQRGRLVMLTEQMTDRDGRPRDVFQYFQRPIETLNSLRQNWNGMVHTGQAVSRAEAIDQPVPPWPDFSTVWIPVAPGVQLHGRMAIARDESGVPRRADCIVLIPGFLGDNAVLRTRDLAIGLHHHGYHVLALELRGHGRVEHYFPDLYYTFGVLETQDLIRVSEWLQDTYACVRDTGLIGFCWGGNHAMLAGWFDGRGQADPSIQAAFKGHFDPPSPRRHYAAGIMAFSPVLRWEDLLDRTDIPHEDMWADPSMYFFQRVIKDRMRRKGYPEVSGNLRRLISYEFAHSELGPTFPMWQAYQFLRFLPYKGRPDGDKLESVRTPMLLVTAINDPFLSAQDLADLTARTANPLVASLILRGGGHIGFAPYNPAYFYSLILNFYDPANGAAATCRQR